MANELTTKTTFSNFLTSPAVKQKINEVIGGINGQRFMTQILSAVTNNPALQECEQMTVFNCALLGESLKLSPSPQLGQYYMVPFKKKFKNKDGSYGETVTASFVLGYKGYIQLAIRSGQYKKLNVIAIKQGELINYDPLNEILDVDLIQDETTREKAKTIGYFAMFEYVNGFRKTLYWSYDKMKIHADKYSAAFDAEKYEQLQSGQTPQSEMWKYSSFWYKDFDGMAFKTMLRQLISKWGIMSIDMQTAFENDIESEKKDNNDNLDNNYFDNQEHPKNEEITNKLNALKPQEQQQEKQAPKKEEKPQPKPQEAEIVQTPANEKTGEMEISAKEKLSILLEPHSININFFIQENSLDPDDEEGLNAIADNPKIFNAYLKKCIK